MLNLSLELNDHLGELLGRGEKYHVAFLARTPFGFLVTLQFWVSLKVTPKRRMLDCNQYRALREESLTHLCPFLRIGRSQASKHVA